MRREDISTIFEGATREQIQQILDLNGADITKAKGDAEQLRQDLAAARTTIAQLEQVKSNADALQKQIDQYQQAEAERAQAQQQAEAQAKLEARFNAVTGERKYLNDYVRRGLMADFSRALQDESNTGKSDADIFAALTKDQHIFASMNPPADGMPPFNPGVGGEDLDALSDAEYYARVFSKPKSSKE